MDTGQINCFNNSEIITCPQQGESFYGQDANYQSNQPSYIDNGDGTITDMVTGLMWQEAFTRSDFGDAQYIFIPELDI